ncbi:MAG TPA: metal ABC transporter substrate-binding protein [Candidatus Thermoplasmatota archaeon]|nr:metal ABC transporter substrate-binding protein [Candidatus Thermoplasmatota archaeon]
MHKATLAMLALTFLAGCAAPPQADVVTTSYPVHFLAERLAGDALAVALVGRPGVDLHAFEPTVRDVQAIRGARLLVHHGLGVEPWVGRTLASLGEDAPPSVEAGTAPPGEDLLHGDGHGEHAGEEAGIDPHTWLDPLAYRAEAGRVADALATHFPEHAAAIAGRAAALHEELGRLDADFRNGLRECQRHAVATNHDAHGYLARRYDFILHSLHGLEPGSQPDPGAVDDVIQAIRREGIPVLFLEEGTDPGAVRAIQEETGVGVETLYTLEQPPEGGQGGYLELQRENLRRLRAALGCA